MTFICLCRCVCYICILHWSVLPMLLCRKHLIPKTLEVRLYLLGFFFPPAFKGGTQLKTYSFSGVSGHNQSWACLYSQLPFNCWYLIVCMLRFASSCEYFTGFPQSCPVLSTVRDVPSQLLLSPISYQISFGGCHARLL